MKRYWLCRSPLTISSMAKAIYHKGYFGSDKKINLIFFKEAIGEK